MYQIFKTIEANALKSIQFATTEALRTEPFKQKLIRSSTIEPFDLVDRFSGEIQDVSIDEYAMASPGRSVASSPGQTIQRIVYTIKFAGNLELFNALLKHSSLPRTPVFQPIITAGMPCYRYLAYCNNFGENAEAVKVLKMDREDCISVLESEFSKVNIEIHKFNETIDTLISDKIQEELTKRAAKEAGRQAFL